MTEPEEPREPSDLKQPGEPSNPILGYRSRDAYNRSSPASFGSGFAIAVLYVLLSIGLLVHSQPGDLYWFGGLAIAVLGFGVHNWAVTGSGRFLGGFLAGALIVLGLGFLAFLAICGRGPYL